ncbi:family 43 glycosylhydrolase [Alkalihalobacillus sp. AL-G]|uniref:family 43 glycosylhydrolase n=1 Tax=Alkalihalobacillus sp. AL-G TaxID=2926399 RepID=UPI00272BBD24|nr:family 43 glycosylhydrolase [Alkalihalobacillus sp. AL-G]WLD92798.1 family 43 glycosylhydrolase [Alkalihalobacillus sp. AL-G]
MLSLLIVSGCADHQNQYANPVFEPVIADPSIVKAGDGYYYAYGTEDAWGEKTKPKLIPIVRSKNLTEWEYVGEAFNEKPSWKKPGGLWAPDIAKYNGKYYLYYSVSIWGDPDPGIGVAVSDKPEGPFKDQGKLFTSEEIGVANSIDPYFIVEDGKPYLFWGSFHGIYGIQLAEDGFSVTGEKFQVAGNAYEAPYIIKRDGFYYFFGSQGSCCEGENSTYHVAVGRSENLNGPYADKAGKALLKNGGTVILQGNLEGSFVGPGHNAVVTDDEGIDWIIYHAIKKEDPLLWTGASRRPLMIDPLIWEDGWPKVENSVPSETKQKAPLLNGT